MEVAVFFSGGKKANPNLGSGGFGFRNTAKQRVWWSDGFSKLPLGSIGCLSYTAGVSSLWVDDSNGIIMTLALPLVESALSLATETLWGRADPFAGAQRRRKEAGNYKSWFDGNNDQRRKR
ncbi:hypothetical protein ACS0TY_004972 [Phlomoides rotata]